MKVAKSRQIVPKQRSDCRSLMGALAWWAAALVPQSLNVAYSDDSSQVLWEDGERIFSRGWRLDDEGKRHDVLIVRPASDHPSRSSLDHLYDEYELKDELDGKWAVRPLEAVRDTSRTLLVLEDAGCGE